MNKWKNGQGIKEKKGETHVSKSCKEERENEITWGGHWERWGDEDKFYAEQKKECFVWLFSRSCYDNPSAWKYLRTQWSEENKALNNRSSWTFAGTSSPCASDTENNPRTHMLFYSFKGVYQQQGGILHVTLICMEMHLSGGSTFNTGQAQRCAEWCRSCGGTRFSCFRVDKVKYSKGQAHPSSGKWRDVKDVLLLHGPERHLISAAVGVPLCRLSRAAPFLSPLVLLLFAATLATLLRARDGWQLQRHMDRRCV